MIPVSALFLVLGRRMRHPGYFTALFWTIYGPFRIWLDQLHVNAPTADTWFGIAATLVGLGAMVWNWRRGHWQPGGP